MSVSRMAKIQLTTVKDTHQQVINVLHNAGVLELEEITNSDQAKFVSDSKSAYWQTNVKFALDLLEEFKDEKKSGLLEKLRARKPELSEQDIAKLTEDFDYKSIVVELENLDKEYNTLINSISQDRRRIKFLQSWRGLPTIDPSETKFVDVHIGVVPITRFEDFRNKIAEEKLIEYTKISESEREVRVVIIAVKEASEAIGTLFEISDFKPAELSVGDIKSIADQIKELDETIRTNRQKVELMKAKIKSYSPNIENFQILYDYLTWSKDQDEAAKKAISTTETISILGWLPNQAIPELKKRIQEVTNQFVLEEVEIKKDENIPIVLANPKAIQPFEAVTEIYGAPLYKEPDPTMYLAPFFILYFALCLSDAAYGFVLALLAYIAIRVMKPQGGAKKLMWLMVFCGLLTIIVGALYGGWFGIALADLGNGPLVSALRAIQMVDPVQNPMSVMIMSFILGFIQLVFGNLLGAYWQIKHGRALDGLLGGGLWALFLLFIGFWICVKVAVLPESLTGFANILLLVGVIAMILTQGREQKNVFLKLASGVSSLYGLVGYLSDVLSYSRLLALGLSTGIIAMVVNLVAGLFAGMVPAYIGWLVWIVIIIGGHLFNLIISALGAFIHSGRLQYVEFFPKFLVGGGRRFKPFTKTTKFITLKS
ncbi:MAG: V-type ATP synthase subunit I [Candidatus Uhrbacteria bacterium]